MTQIQKYSPATWSRRVWIAVFVSPLAFSLTLTACAPSQPAIEQALDNCTEYLVEEQDAHEGYAAIKCQEAREDLGERRFIDVWIQP